MSKLNRKRMAIGLALAALVGPWAALADTGVSSSAGGNWAFRLDVHAGAAPEQSIGVLDLHPGGTCEMRLRSNFAGAAHDHSATSCTWRGGADVEPARPGIDGLVTVTGVAEPGPSIISFVVADRGERLLLMLDDTAPGILGTGEAFRR